MGYARAGLLTFLLLVLLGCAQAQVRPLTILHTNDLHAHLIPDSNQQGGFAQLAAVLRREKEGCQACLVLNGGDLVQGTPVSTIYRGLPIYELANLLHFDASVLGNHEFDYGWQRIGEFLQAARFPVIAANVVNAQGQLLAPHPYVILTAGETSGIRVAVIGALTADLLNLTTPDRYGPWRVLPLVETVARYAREVRGQSDLIVVLGHLTPEEEEAILRQVPEVAAVISGHVHAGLDAPVEVDGRVVVRMRAYGVEVGRLDLQVDVARKQVVHSSWKRIPVNRESAPPAEDMALAVEQWESKVREIVDVPIGTAKRSFTREELKPLIEQAMAEELGTDLAFWNIGGIRDTLPAGTIMARSIWNILPFDNRFMIGRFRGSQLPPSITAGREIDPDREYTLAVSDFVATNQRAEMGAAGLEFPQQTNRVDRDVIMDWIRKKKVLE
jgi:2',3'-cyclic-nucleotide 2'-phosphodiesterase (5'-nucleotidase family)